jgi:hypothetical protein
MAAFFKKNTLEQTRFTLTTEGFAYAGLNYAFADVVETVIYRQVFETKVLLVGSDRDHSISILFVMRTGERVQLTEQPTWLGSSKVDKVERIQEIYNLVSAKTFENRLKKYLDQLKSFGYFEYASWRFYPDQKKVINTETQRAYSSQTSKFMRSYGFIEVISEADGLGARLSQKVKGQIGITTLHDTDVFFALLKHQFNLTWK